MCKDHCIVEFHNGSVSIAHATPFIPFPSDIFGLDAKWSSWIEAPTGCGSIDFIGGAEWIRGRGALGAPDLYPIRETAELGEGGGASCGRYVVLSM
jgi:hypothetical protein